MLRFVMHAHARKPPGVRRKLDRVGLEMAAALAALVHNSHLEVLANHPLSAAALEKDFRGAFVEGDANLELELQSALAEKRADWNPTELTALASLLKNQAAASNASLPEEVESVRLQVTQLEQEEFSLLKKKVQYDVRVWRVWSQKVQDRQTQLYYQELEHKMQRNRVAEQLAASLFDRTHRNFRLHLIVANEQGNAQSTFAELEGLVKQLQQSRAGGAGSVVLLGRPNQCVFSFPPSAATPHPPNIIIRV